MRQPRDRKRYRTIRIPESVLQRIHNRLLSEPLSTRPLLLVSDKLGFDDRTYLHYQCHIWRT
jgi:hypothetical protein